jgi:hypothetical protein
MYTGAGFIVCLNCISMSWRQQASLEILTGMGVLDSHFFRAEYLLPCSFYTVILKNARKHKRA